MRNIRSYGESMDPISFDEGITLFEGDIGSGKSTILLAIEFALFGLGDTDSTHLLRLGADGGEVELDFEAGGRLCTALRTLKRTKTGAKVGRCVLTVDGSEKRLAPSEMKPRVLKLLGYREPPDPKASSVIFRYGVYTPQEEMRSILAQGKQVRELRKQTLRRAFGIEDYKVAAENLRLVATEVDRRIARYDERASRCEEVGRQLGEARASVEALGSELTSAGKALEEARGLEARARERLDAAQALEDALREARSAQSARNAELATAIGQRDLAAERLATAERAAAELVPLRARIGELGAQLADLKALEDRAREVDRLRKAKVAVLERQSKARARLERAVAAEVRRSRLEAELASLSDPAERIAGAEGELKEAERSAGAHDGAAKAAAKDLESLGDLEEGAACPCCHQPLTAEHLGRLRKRLRGAMRESASRRTREEERAAALRDELARLRAREQERATLQKTMRSEAEEASKADDARRALAELDPEGVTSALQEAERGLDPERLEGLRRLDKERDGLERLAREKGRQAAGLEALQRAAASAAEAVGAAEAALAAASEGVKQMAGRHDPAALARAREEHAAVADNRRARETEVEVTSRRLEEARSRAAELAEEVRMLESVRGLAVAYEGTHDFLRSCLGPALEAIERTVMSALAQDMDRDARIWFDMLVEDPELELRIEEDFSPSVRQREWDVDVAALSGGERTSVAFAYRLALNGMVRRIAAPGSSNILILDEPTDGFSKEQLSRMGAVLERLEADQVVIVSHERELDAFSDRVYRVEKTAGTSHVRPYG